MLRRRDVLKGLSAVALLQSLPLGLGCTKEDSPTAPPDAVFVHGVASGDPLPDAVILWTRVTTDQPTASVRREVAKDAQFASILKSGTEDANADRDYTVKIDATGLEPGTTYYYRFTALGKTSPIGRTRTAPVDAPRLRFAVVSCASHPHGYFHVYRAIAERTDIDAIVHLGDYMYEYADGDYGKIRNSEPRKAVESLADYRTRYGQYRRDADLQEAHRQHPFICIWDDHEFIDNAYKDGTTGDNSAVGGTWAERRTAATRAYAEWIPVREQADQQKIWRSLRYGNLAELILLDTRVWGRDKQLAAMDPLVGDPARQILGADQEAWLSERLTTSTSKWKLVCQQVLMTEVPSSFRDDGWDDYPAARGRFYDILEKSSVDDVVVLSGDVHSSWACDLPRTPTDPATYDAATGRGALAVELVTPAVSSPGQEPGTANTLAADFGWIKFAELEKRGYILLDVNEQRAHASWFHIDDVEEKDRTELKFVAGFATYAGENHLRAEQVPPETLPGAPLAPAPPEGTV